MALLGLRLVLLMLPAAAQGQPNMNGDYILSATPQGSTDKFPKTFADYGRDVASFDVYSPTISTLYSQVFWAALEPVDLPADIVQHILVRIQARHGREHPSSIASQEEDMPRMAGLAGRDVIGDMRKRVRNPAIFCPFCIIVQGHICFGAQSDVL